MKKKISAILVWTLFVQTVPVHAAQTAKVLMVRGKVTKLLPGKSQASLVKRGEVLPEDTSVLTQDRSLVRLRFADNSTMNLGPKSKVVISKMPEQKPNMINLLTGAVKAEVNKKDNNKNKMIVKTRSAVMGVRGTKFQATFNPVNKSTTLVTVEGKVAMVNKEKVVEKASEQSQVVVDSDKELDIIDQKLNEPNKEIVEVDAGKFSGVQAEAAPPTPPVKIAPVQYEAIAKTMGSDKKAEEVMKTEDAQAEVAELEGAPRPGGFVDFATGIYVPPPKDAKLDEKTATFTGEGLGGIDQETGDYVPPKGVKLDPKKGFVVDKKEVARLASAGQSDEDLQRTLATVAKVNDEIKQQIEVNRIEAKSSGPRPWYSPESHHLSAEFVPYSEALELKAGGDGDSDFYSKSAFDALLVWSQKWGAKWSTRFKFGGADYEFEDEDKFGDDFNDEVVIASMGGVYAYSDRLSLEADFVSRPMFFVVPNDAMNMPEAQVVSGRMDYLSLGARYFLMDWKKLAVNLSGHAMIFGEDKLNTNEGDETLESFGLRGALSALYSYSKSLGLEGTVFAQTINHDVTTANDAEFNRTTLGTAVQMFWNL